MAYLRREKEALEMDYPIDVVWSAIPKAIETLKWEVEETDEEKMLIKTKTKSKFLSYASTLTIDAVFVNEKTSRVYVSAETPVTTITGIVDFGRTRERIDIFFEALIRQLVGGNKESEKK